MVREIYAKVDMKVEGGFGAMISVNSEGSTSFTDLI